MDVQLPAIRRRKNSSCSQSESSPRDGHNSVDTGEEEFRAGSAWFMEKMRQTCTTSRWEKSDKLFIQKQDIYILTKGVSLADLVLKPQNLGWYLAC